VTKLKKKLYKYNIIILLIVLLLVIIAFLSVNIICIFYKDLDYLESIDIKIGDEIPKIDKYVDSENLKKLDSNEIEWQNIDNSDIEDNKIYRAGEYLGYIDFRNEKVVLKLNVIDDVKPTINGVNNITIYVNNTVDLLKNIKVTDNSIEDVNIKVIGEYDIKKVGEYKLSYVATDKSGNETVKDFKLVVKEKEVSKPSNIGSSVVGTTSKGYEVKKVNGIYYIEGVLIANKTYSLPSNYAPGGLLSSFNNAFNKMKSDASSQGVNLKIISGYRSYSSQKSIYNNYVKKDGVTKADTYSARAGHSEHQTGLAADINSLYTSFINTKEGKWLNDNCYKYGFIIRYPKGKSDITGYMYEPWHIRYVGVELATKLYNGGNWITLEEYFGITSKYSN